MAKYIKRSPAPVYALAAVWLVWGLFLPLYALWHFLLAAVLSAMAFFAVKKICPDRTIVLPEPEPEPEPEQKPKRGRRK